MSARPFDVQSIDHLTIIVADLEATTRFYVELLGMRLVPRPAFDFPGAWYETDGCQIHATVASDMAGLAGWGDRKVKSLSRGHHFAFQVPDVATAVNWLQQQGVEIAVAAKNRPDGATQAYVYDPDQHLVEVFSLPAKM